MAECTVPAARVVLRGKREGNVRRPHKNRDGREQSDKPN